MAVATAVAAVDEFPAWLGAAVTSGVDGDSQSDDGPNERRLHDALSVIENVMLILVFLESKNMELGQDISLVFNVDAGAAFLPAMAILLLLIPQSGNPPFTPPPRRVNICPSWRCGMLETSEVQTTFHFRSLNVDLCRNHQMGCIPHPDGSSHKFPS